MCGICGHITRPGKAPPERRVIEAMNQSQLHRGPDSEGVWIEDGVGLGHRRLTILDLSDIANQPMMDAQKRAVMVFNGEIYNYLEIRDQLIAKGHTFTSTGDTEVLLLGYLEWGVDVLQRLNGMYAFAIYDFRKSKLFCARDPVGQKPFLYHQGKGGFVFASELTALLKHPMTPTVINREAVAHFMINEGFAAPHTPLEGVCKLPPGHGLIYTPKTDDLKIWRHWDVVGDPPPISETPPEEKDFEQLEDVLHGAMTRHLRSDVTVGVYLSGGIDSSTMAVLASDILGAENVRTYTVASSEPSFNEADEAKQTAEFLGTNHHETTLTPEQCLETLPDILEKMDEPLSDPGMIAVYQVAAFASQHVKVIISGDGGDEFMCGYPPFAKWALGERLESLPAWMVQGVLRSLVDLAPAQYGYMGLFYKMKLFSRGFGRPATARNMAWIGSFLPQEISGLLVGGADMDLLKPTKDGVEAIYDSVADVHLRAGGFDAIARLGCEYQAGYLTNCICAHTDKANMMHSLEARAPFLDTQVMRYFSSLPTSWKLRGNTGKWFMRQYLHRRLGQEVAAKKKQGFTVPIALWLRGELKTFAGELLDVDLLRQSGVFNPEAVQKLWREHQNGTANHYKQLWTLICFQSWWKNNLL